MRSVIENENFFGNTKTANFSIQIYDQIQNRLTRPKTKNDIQICSVIKQAGPVINEIKIQIDKNNKEG